MKQRMLLAARTGVTGLTLHPDTAEKLGICQADGMRLRFGNESRRIDIALSPAAGQNELQLAPSLIRDMRIPAFPSYELVCNGEELLLGPYIGFLVAYRMKAAARYVNNLADYMKLYETVGGAVVAFSLDGVDKAQQTITGYLYHPRTKRWIKGTYPYPAAIFIRGHVKSARWVKHFKTVLGPNVFNDFYLDKWQMHNLLQRSPVVSRYLPATSRLANGAELLAFLKRYRRAYLKPVNGTMGMGIMHAAAKREGVLVRYRVAGKEKRAFLRDAEQVAAFFAKRLAKTTVIMQEELPLVNMRGKLVDFRLIIVKNGAGDWEYMGMIARSGGKGSYVSNVSAGGRAEAGEVVLQRALGLTNDERVRMSERLAALAYQVAAFLDEQGLHCGNMGIDVGIDAGKHLWIIEIQHYSPAHSIAVDAGNPGMYRKILRNNLHYVKRLAGFKGEFV